jgi:hypothetical protein
MVASGEPPSFGFRLRSTEGVAGMSDCGASNDDAGMAMHWRVVYLPDVSLQRPAHPAVW